MRYICVQKLDRFSTTLYIYNYYSLQTYFSLLNMFVVVLVSMHAHRTLHLLDIYIGYTVNVHIEWCLTWWCLIYDGGSTINGNFVACKPYQPIPWPPTQSVTVMMSVQEVPGSLAQRIIVKFLSNEGVKPSEMLTRLQAQFGNECLSQTRVYDWAKSFRDRRQRVENEPDARQPTKNFG